MKLRTFIAIKATIVMLIGMALVYGCGGGKKENIPVYKLEEGVPERAVNMSELVDSVKIIRLETVSDGLVGGRCRIWCGDKYILTVGNDAVLQFTADGKFIRKLAVTGKAPEEYISYTDIVVDEKQERFYLCDYTGRFLEYNLSDGTFVGSKRLKHGVLENSLLMPDGTVVYIPRIPRKDTCVYYLSRVTLEGEWVNGIKKVIAKDDNSNLYLNNLNGEIHFMGYSAEDILSRICDTVCTPILKIEHENRYRNYEENKGKGDVARIMFENSRLLVVSLFNEEHEQGQIGSGVRMSNERLYILDKENGTVEKMKSFCVDELQYITRTEPPYGFMPTVSGKYFCIPLSAMKLRNALKDKLDNDKLSSADRERFSQLYQETVDDDNPLLAIGIIR